MGRIGRVEWKIDGPLWFKLLMLPVEVALVVYGEIYDWFENEATWSKLVVGALLVALLAGLIIEVSS